jgi:MORN repeat
MDATMRIAWSAISLKRESLMVAQCVLPFLILFAVPVFAQAPQSEWIEDFAGCGVWNPKPEPNEVITWMGPCANGMAQGIGVLHWLKDGAPNGRYEGEYLDGKQNGQGTFTQPDGTTYVGTFLDGKRTGQGTVIWPNGDKLGRELII